MTMLEAPRRQYQRLLSRRGYRSPEERDWYERHEPWLRELVEQEITRRALEPAYIVTCALDLIFDRACEEQRRPCWALLDVKELLLEELPYSGVPDHLGSRDMIAGLREFITWMGQHGKLNAGVAACLVQRVYENQEQFLDWFGDTEPRPAEPLTTALSRGEAWLHCARCDRFFQARHLTRDFLGNREGCPLSGCTGSGLEVDIFRWDAFRDSRNPRWPGDPAQLHHGMEAPTGELNQVVRASR